MINKRIVWVFALIIVFTALIAVSNREVNVTIFNESGDPISVVISDESALLLETKVRNSSFNLTSKSVRLSGVLRTDLIIAVNNRETNLHVFTIIDQHIVITVLDNGEVYIDKHFFDPGFA